MISEANKALVFNAIQSVQQKRASAAQALAAATKGAQGKLTGGGKTPVKKPAAKKPTKAGPAPEPGITPYLTATDMMGVGDAQAAYDRAVSEATFGEKKAQADAQVAAGDIERGRVKSVEDIGGNAAARGLFDSGIRTGGVGMANSGAARAQQQVQGGLALTVDQAGAQRDMARRALESYMQASAAKSAENGMALPVNPSQNGATNIVGAATKKKAPLKRPGRR